MIPWLLTRWEVSGPTPWWAPLAVRMLGEVPLAVGMAHLLHSFGRFVVEGLGTPLPAWWPRLRPWDPSVLGPDRVTAERGEFG